MRPTVTRPAPAPPAPDGTWWDDLFDRCGSVRAVAVMRIALGPITLLHLRPFLRDARAGRAYDDHFWEPFLPWLPHLPRSVEECGVPIAAAARSPVRCCRSATSSVCPPSGGGSRR